MTSLPEMRSQTEYCDVHCNNGHDTKQCIELRKEIEQAISQGYLKEFIDRCADKRQEYKRKNDQDKNQKGHVHR